MTESNVLERRAINLPPEYQQKILDYIDPFILDVETNKTSKPLLNWAEVFSGVQEDVLSIQKKALLRRAIDEG